ncbi:MAG: glycosyltransferase family 39 protein [Candidatus Altiarchaeota archaeon]|nr:glycosyltransferase family 39 protein [Candidatus Altiarchaeota archaeon]
MGDGFESRRGLMLILAVLLVSILFRFPNLELMPSWMWDEGVNMNISWNLSEGRMQWFTLTYPFIPHPPLFFMISALLLKLSGNYLVYMRLLTAVYGVWTTFLLYLLGKEAFDSRTGLVAGLLFAVYPWAVYFNRMAYANNQLMLLYILTLYLLLRFHKTGGEKWLILSAFTSSLALLTEYTGIALVASVLCICYLRRKDLLVKALVLSTGPALLFTVVMLFLMPEAFIHDLMFTLERFRKAVTGLLIAAALYLVYRYLLRKQVSDLVKHAITFYRGIILNAVHWSGETSGEEKIRRARINLMLSLSFISLMMIYLSLKPLSAKAFFGSLDLYWLGLFGFMFIKKKELRDLMFISLLPMFLVICGFGRLDHMIIPIYPMFALGLGLLLSEIYLFMASLFSWNTLIKLLVFGILLYPLTYLAWMDYKTFMVGDNPMVALEDVGARFNVSCYVNSRVGGDELVLADSHFTRFLDGKVSVILQSVAIEGRGTVYMSGDYGSSRFTHNCSYRKARFIIIHEDYTTWLEVNCPEVARHLGNCTLREINGFEVYECPTP